MPRISVVMSVFNGARYIAEAVDSILNQTFSDFELIIINDGSTDGTGNIIGSYKDSRVVIVNQKHMGIPKSRNRGGRLSKGEYIAVHDADDVSLPTRLEYGVRFLDENPDYALVGSAYYLMDEKGRKHGLVRVLTEDADLRTCLMKRNCIGHGSVMMRTSAFLGVGGYREKFKYSLDYDLILRIAEVSKVANMKEPLYYYRLVRTGVTVKKMEEQKCYAKMALLDAEGRGILCKPDKLKYDRSGMLGHFRASLDAEGFYEAARIGEIYGRGKLETYGHFFFKLAETRVGFLLRRYGMKGIVRLYRKLFHPHISDNI